MGAFNYDASAELFFGTGSRMRPKSLKYQRFERASEAIRHVMEDIPSEAILGCSLDVADETYVGKAILPLYDSPDYPLQRRPKTRAGTASRTQEPKRSFFVSKPTRGG